jgi:nitrogen fixation NifU-like protein
MSGHPEPDFDDLYREVVFEHYREPRGREPLEREDVSMEGMNPTCGDEVDVALQVDDGHIAGVRVVGRGCAISVASGSILFDLLEGVSLDDARRYLKSVKAVMHGEPFPEDLDLGDFDALEGVKRFPVRIKCALLPWTTLERALAQVANNGAAGAAPDGGDA